VSSAKVKRPKGDVRAHTHRGHPRGQRTPQLIPLCHPLRITGVDVTFGDDLKRGELMWKRAAPSTRPASMEALTAAAVARSPSTTW
jgi:cyclic pyranopterin phosphate synthase